MKKSRLDYTSPTAEVFVLHFEGGLCQSPGVTVNGTKNGKGYGNAMFYLDDDEED